MTDRPRLRELPAVHDVVVRLGQRVSGYPHGLVVEEVRRAIAEARESLLVSRYAELRPVEEVVMERLRTIEQPSLRPVINATGVVLHTNLGRAPLGALSSPPGYSTGTHSHPYMEIVTVIEGTGEAWIGSEANVTPIGPGSTIVAHPNQPHGFRNTGKTPMRSYGVHASPARITNRESGGG